MTIAFYPKNWQKHPHFQYLSPYQHININISHITYAHITYHIPYTTCHIPTYQHITYPHTNISHTTYQHIIYHIPHTTYHYIPHPILFLLFRGFFLASIFVFANILLSCPKIIPLLEFKSILWNWSLQINGILVNSAFGNVSTSS